MQPVLDFFRNLTLANILALVSILVAIFFGFLNYLGRPTKRNDTPSAVRLTNESTGDEFSLHPGTAGTTVVRDLEITTETAKIRAGRITVTPPESPWWHHILPSGTTSLILAVLFVLLAIILFVS